MFFGTAEIYKLHLNAYNSYYTHIVRIVMKSKKMRSTIRPLSCSAFNIYGADAVTCGQRAPYIIAYCVYGQPQELNVPSRAYRFSFQ